MTQEREEEGKAGNLWQGFKKGETNGVHDKLQPQGEGTVVYQVP